MCGIAAIVGRTPVSSTQGWAMAEALRHRGPDGQGVVVVAQGKATVQYSPAESPLAGDVVLGHSRLAIIDLSSAGFQPMTDEAKRFWVVYNGEIYNFLDLRRELEGRGHSFASRTDTEVIVHGWDEWGEGLLQRLEGMFAFCLHDAATGCTVLARDRLGVKPLYYATRSDGAFLAASEVKALLAAGLDARLDPDGVNRFLTWLWVPDPGTAFAGVEKLPPGHILTLQADGSRTTRPYWDLEFEPDGLAFAEQSAHLHEAVRDAVTRELVSDVPLGAFFSGGLDSTAVVEMMRRYGGKPPTCFTVGFAPRDLSLDVIPDDLRFARPYAAKTGIDYREEVLQPNLVEALPKVVWHMDEPVADPAALAAYRITEVASDVCTVMLSGVGGDELFGGYPRYRAAALAQRYRALPSAARAAIRGGLRLLPAAGAGRLPRLGRNAHKLIDNADAQFPDDYLSFLTYFDSDARAELYTSDFRSSLSGIPVDASHRDHLARVRGDDWLHQVMYLDVKTYLPALNLTYMDRMSMAHSVEVRVPLLDELVVEVMRRAPAEAKLRGRELKVLFRSAMRGVVPDDILVRSKAGFSAPARGWLLHELRPLIDDLLSPETTHRRGLFRPPAVERLIKDFRSGRRDSALQVWQLLTLELWQQAFLDGRHEAAPTRGARVSASGGGA